MDYRSRRSEEVDITKQELKDLKDAFQKEEFRKLFADYVAEVNDPKNKAIYEKEMTQFEKERGVDITFIHPSPGYVIKTSENGLRKTFVNICTNENVGRPSYIGAEQNGTQGVNLSLPYFQGGPRIEFDKNKNQCTIYDVIFHPYTLHCAKTNPKFKTVVNETALNAVEESFKVKLDKTNLKFPKAQYKGMKEATVVRRKVKGFQKEETEEDVAPFPAPNYPYNPPEEDPKPKVIEMKNEEPEEYVTPKYTIKQRKGVEMHELTDELDSKVYAATPSELVVIIDLPLISNASDVTLDVYTRSLALISERPSKYKLNLKLPWAVNEDEGSAKFDKSTKKLHITLPVIKKGYEMPEYIREDSGIESDPNPSVKSSSEEDISDGITGLSLSNDVLVPPNIEIVDDSFRTSNCSSDVDQLPPFLNPDYHYSFPSYHVNHFKNNLTFIFYVSNVEIGSIKHQITESNTCFHVCFTSVGSGFFPVHYAFCTKIPGVRFDPVSVEYDPSEDNLVVRTRLTSVNSFAEYYIGAQPESLSKACFPDPDVIANDLEGFQSDDDEEEEDEGKQEAVLSSSCGEGNVGDKAKVLLEEEVSPSAEDLYKEDGEFPETKKKAEGFATERDGKQLKKKPGSGPKDIVVPAGKSKKSRTLSDSSQQPQEASRRRSILKSTSSRSLSESNTEEYMTWSSVDSSDSVSCSAPLLLPLEEAAALQKKTVRFSDVISEKVYRANSSILGQRKKNQRKSRNKKRAQERRTSESGEEEEDKVDVEEITDSDDFLDSSSGCEESYSSVSEASSGDEDSCCGVVAHHQMLLPPTPSRPQGLPGSKCHRRRGSKNKRKNAATEKHNTIFTMDD